MTVRNSDGTEEIPTPETVEEKTCSYSQSSYAIDTAWKKN